MFGTDVMTDGHPFAGREVGQGAPRWVALRTSRSYGLDRGHGASVRQYSHSHQAVTTL